MQKVYVSLVERSRLIYIDSMYMGGINPILHFNQHWYIGMDVKGIQLLVDNVMPQTKKYYHYLFSFCYSH